jgi:hypothetical protein
MGMSAGSGASHVTTPYLRQISISSEPICPARSASFTWTPGPKNKPSLPRRRKATESGATYSVTWSEPLVRPSHSAPGGT